MSAVDYWSPRPLARTRRTWRRVDRLVSMGAGWQIYAPPKPAPAPAASFEECQPEARPEGDEWRPACRCGWQALTTRPNRADAMLRAQEHDRRENPV